MTRKQLEDAANKIESSRSRFLEIMNFVRENQNIVEEVKNTWLSKLLRVDSAKMKIRLLYIDTINAAGGNNLERTGKSCKSFFNIVDVLDDRRQIAMKKFYTLFGENIQDHRMLFETIAMDKERFGNFGQKKTALFLRHIHVLHIQGDPRNRFISDYNIDTRQLVIPVDRVIVTVLNRIWGTDFSANGHFNEINDFARLELGNEFMLVEDLWFWGYFNTKVENGQQEIHFTVNEDKYYSANFIYPNGSLYQKLHEFSRLINQA
ncbi:MAG: hypothetical protein EPGJADBJ_00858 [Saprospiraceae bacterium]|nr:hypothetical protein [Saprospiraceae bacterium]